MLPLPTWPKAIGRIPGSRSVTTAVAHYELGDAADRHRDVVLDRAQIILRFDDHLPDAATVPWPARTLSAMTPSAMRSSVSAPSRSLSRSPRMPLSVWLDDISIGRTRNGVP